MTIRYMRDGLRVVRVEVGPPVADPDAAPSLASAADDYHIRLRRFGTELRAAVRRSRQPTYGVTPGLVREARRRAGLGQRQLGQQLGISRSTVAEGELGRRPIHQALAEWAAGVLRGAAEGEP